MKKIVLLVMVLSIALIKCDPVYAIPKYSEETQRLMREAGLEMDNDWETISRNQEAYRKRKAEKNRANSYSSVNDELHTAPAEQKANDGYRYGNFDELHINENYRNDVWQPAQPVYRLNGFDEFHLPNEL